MSYGEAFRQAEICSTGGSSKIIDGRGPHDLAEAGRERSSPGNCEIVDVTQHLLTTLPLKSREVGNFYWPNGQCFGMRDPAARREASRRNQIARFTSRNSA
jgi:hypothetical protein